MQGQGGQLVTVGKTHVGQRATEQGRALGHDHLGLLLPRCLQRMILIDLAVLVVEISAKQLLVFLEVVGLVTHH